MWLDVRLNDKGKSDFLVSEASAGGRRWQASARTVGVKKVMTGSSVSVSLSLSCL